MCVENATISTRKRVLGLIHELAVSKSKGLNDGRASLHALIEQWIDELADAHKPDKCSKCGHKHS